MRLLKVWYLRKPSCHLLAFRLRSQVYRQLYDKTGAVFWVDGTVRFDGAGEKVEVIVLHMVLIV